MKYATASSANPPKTITPLFITPGLLKSTGFGFSVAVVALISVLFTTGGTVVTFTFPETT